MLDVLMYPSPDRIREANDGISQVVTNYGKYSEQHGFRYVGEGEPHDIVAVHAGMMAGAGKNLVSHCHGLYWTGDRQGETWERKANKNVIASLRQAKIITVPSSWVGETIARDMHVQPVVVPHGINLEDWQDVAGSGNYVLWNKNRQTVTCNPKDMNALALKFPNVQFVSTFGTNAPNVHLTGKMPFARMQGLIKGCAIYLATVKETGGIGIMEAMAAGKPILGYASGAITDLVQHGVNGFLAKTQEELFDGLIYCIENKDVLGENSRNLAENLTWSKATAKVAEVYRAAVEEEPATASIIIPCYNYAPLVGRAIESAIAQTYKQLEHIIVVDDGSTDNTREVVAEWMQRDQRVRYIHQSNAGVAIARNRGIRETDSKYICCLDADDFLQPGFLSVCINELEQDRSLGVAYTKLKLISRDGTREAREPSEWPGEFNYDQQVRGLNQVPTCCVYRREAWERLGGYRQRYAPRGCGSEDAEFWLRMGSIGYGAKLATTEPMFVYSFGGRTTGDSNYVEIDWLAWHPWTHDALHPFASVATPAKDSHAVLSYDEPLVSVVVPVGPGHENNVVNALDSLEAQSFRKWEAICVWDSPNTKILEERKKAYPFVRWEDGGGLGAGHARNVGARVARAPLLMFLDADDWFYSQMLERCVDEYSAEGGEVAIYTDSVGKAKLSKETVRNTEPGKILFYDGDTQETVIAQKNKEYNWEKAMLQPNQADMYIWCYISTLHPTSWFFEVGGFDESMISWEDWDYWLRIARMGKCFIHLEEELMVYPYYTGNRREQGRENWVELANYMRGKYEGMPMRRCGSCGGRRTRPRPTTTSLRTSVVQTAERGVSVFDFDDDMIMISYNSPNRGDHRVIGHAQFSYPIQGLRMISVGGAMRVDYGYRKQGDRFLVHRNELEAAPDLFKPVSASIPEIQIAEQSRRPTPRPPEKLVSIPLTGKELEDQKFDLQTIPGVSSDIAEQLRDAGVDIPEDIIELGVEGLKELRGVGNRKAEIIYSATQKRLEDSS